MAEISEGNGAEWEAAQWVARRMGDQPYDEEGFHTWLSGDPQRKPLFEKMWGSVMGMGMDSALDSMVRQQRTKKAAIAAGIAAASLLVGLYMALPTVELFMASPQYYAASDGTIRTITLEDGTRLIMAGGAQLRVRYTSHNREVELLRGTVFANVAHNAGRPFRIEAGKGRVTVLGTKFEVALKPENIRVTVEEGHVRFGPARWFSKPLDLTASQAASLHQHDMRLDKEKGAHADVARWRKEWVEYRDVQLERVIEDLGSASPVPISISDNRLARLRVSGRIRLTDPVKQIENLSYIHDFNVDKTEDAIVISHKK